jgi:hypothetical protein
VLVFNGGRNKTLYCFKMSAQPIAAGRRNWLFAAGLGLGLPVAYGLYFLGAGKAPSPGLFIGPLGMFIVVGLLAASAKSGAELAVPPPAEIGAMLREELDGIGLGGTRLVYVSRGEGSDFPRPLALNNVVSLSRRVCEDLSPEALAWSVKTDALAMNRFMRWMNRILIPSLFACIFMIGLTERPGIPAWVIALAVAAVPAMLIAMVVVSFAAQFRADRLLTVTEADRAAATEALSYPYFAQLDRKKGQKWLYFRSELRARARRLGIILERVAHSNPT